MSEGTRPSATPRRSRSALRQATLILPTTGERVKRVFTLRNPAREQRYDSDERLPLLSRTSFTDDDTWLQRVSYQTREKLWHLYAFAKSRTGQGILKCSIAYLLGCMATFVPFLRDFLGKNDGKHMVATVTVYFHPARSTGSMQEAILLAAIAFLYTAFISFTSMAVSVFFGRHHLLALGHVVVLIVFCGGGLGFIGWLKQKLGNPLVNVACSLASLATITVLTKEGSIQAAQFSYVKVVQVLKMVIMGCVSSACVSLFIKPVSARKMLRDDIRKATDCLGVMMTMITRGFLSGSEEELKSPAFVNASKQYKVVFKSMVKNLGEAKYEHYLAGTEEAFHIVSRVVKRLERLSLDIRGLRSAATTQFSLLAKPTGDGQNTPLSRSTSDMSAPRMETSPLEQRFNTLFAIEESPEEGATSDAETNSLSRSHTFPSGAPTAVAAADIFSLFITHLGPPMKSLAYTLGGVLEELPYGPAPKYRIVVNNQFQRSLVDANELFTKARREALTLVYKNKVPSSTRAVEVIADYEEVAASCGYFSSSLQDLAEDTIKYLDILQELKEEYERSPRRRSWKWLLFWRKRQPLPSSPSSCALENGNLVEENPEQSLTQEINPLSKRHESWSKQQKPSRQQSYYYRFWKLLSFFRRDDIKYAIKVGIGAMIYAGWSFLPSTRPIYNLWRGEWGLLSYMLVCSMTIGASNTTGFQRFLGTCLGAISAIIAWIASNENPFILGFFGWLVSLGCFYIIVGQGKGPMGRFILLTYNLSALYAYSLSAKDDDDDDDEGGVSPEIWEIVLHRVVAVMIGCLWGIIVTRLIWPISARRKLKDGLCLLWLRMGLIWKRDPLNIITDGATTSSYMNIRESIELQRFVTHLETVRNSAKHEFELKGPFPDRSVKRILDSTSRMIDAFHAMDVVIRQDRQATPGEAALLRYTTQDRMQLSMRISHLFSVLTSSYKLEFPLNDAMPNIEHVRDRFLAKLFEYRKNNADNGEATDEDYELLYCYALLTGQLANEIKIVGEEIEKLYGVLDEDSLKLQ